VSKETLTITDNRTGQTYEIPVNNDTIRAIDLRQIKVSEGDFGMMSYDPAYSNTASCKSTITFIDGDKGILLYRGYPIEQLAERSNYLEVAYLLLYGELPSKSKYDKWVHDITHHTFIHENIKKFMDGFRYDAHPMGMLLGTVGALSTFYPEAKEIFDTRLREIQLHRLIAKLPTIAAFSYRRTVGQPYVYPDNDLSYTGNFLNMMFKMTELKYKPDPVIEKAIDVLFMLHADHEQNCSTSAMRSVGSSLPDPFSATAAAIAALYGPLHGGANEAVLNMLQQIESKDKIPERAKIVKQIAHEVFEVTGKNPLLDIALELERIVLEDEYFVKRKLYPNVDFYSGLIYQSMALPTSMFTVLFAIARTAGWLAQWKEMLQDEERKISRPRQIYVGPEKRDYIPNSTPDSANEEIAFWENVTIPSG